LVWQKWPSKHTGGRPRPSPGKTLTKLPGIQTTATLYGAACKACSGHAGGNSVGIGVPALKPIKFLELWESVDSKNRVSLNALHKFTTCTPTVSAYGVHLKHCWSTDPCTPRSVECGAQDSRFTGLSESLHTPVATKNDECMDGSLTHVWSALSQHSLLRFWLPKKGVQSLERECTQGTLHSLCSAGRIPLGNQVNMMYSAWQ
jgi:hypothetical protein